MFNWCILLIIEWSIVASSSVDQCIPYPSIDTVQLTQYSPIAWGKIVLTHTTLIACVLIEYDDGSETGFPITTLTRNVPSGLYAIIYSASSIVICHTELEGSLWVCWQPLRTIPSSVTPSLTALECVILFITSSAAVGRKHIMAHACVLGRHGSVSLCRVERENKMAATYNVLAFKRWYFAWWWILYVQRHLNLLSGVAPSYSSKEIARDCY